MVEAAHQLVLAPRSTGNGGSRLLVRRRVDAPDPHACLGLESDVRAEEVLPAEPLTERLAEDEVADHPLPAGRAHPDFVQGPYQHTELWRVDPLPRGLR